MKASTTFESIWKAVRGDEAQTAFKNQFMLGSTLATYAAWFLLTCIMGLAWGSQFGTMVHVEQISTFFQDPFVRQTLSAAAIVSGLFILSLNLKLSWNALYALLLLPVTCFFVWLLAMLSVLLFTLALAVLAAIIFILIVGAIRLPTSKVGPGLYYLMLALFHVANGITWCKNYFI